MSEESAAPTVRLHSLNGITLAAVLGGPLGSVGLMAANASRLGDAPWKVLAGGVAATAALVGLALALPDAAARGIAPVSILAVRGAAQALQGPRLEAHERSGGSFVTLWAAAGAGLASLVVTLGVLFAVLFPFLSDDVKKLPVGSGQLLYGAGVEEPEARKLGDALRDLGFFGETPQDVLVLREKGTLSVRFFMARGSWSEKDTRDAFQEVREVLATRTFPGTPVEVALCDPEGTVHLTLR